MSRSKKRSAETSKIRGTKGRPGRRTKEMIEIAKERIRILMALAEREAVFNNNPVRARRYVTLARKLGMRYNVRLTQELKIKFCRKCNSYLAASADASIRCRPGKIVVHCKHCGNIIRMPIYKIPSK